MPASSPSRNYADLPLNVWLVGQESPARQRSDRYSQASVQGHPGKLLPEIARKLIESYTRPDDLILDPMSGIGTTGVEALHLGRHYVGIELEPRFAAWQRENLLDARAAGATGTSCVITADARRLDPAHPKHGSLLNDFPLVDAVLTSPPYGDRLRRQRNPSRLLRELTQAGKFGRNVLPDIYGPSSDNLGNLRDAAYLAAMHHVYAGCFHVLRPGGILALVIQPGRERHCFRPLHHETIRLCRQAGFEFLDEILAVLARVTPERLVAHARFFRRLRVAQLREQGHPVTLNQVEYVLVFRKPEAAEKRR